MSQRQEAISTRPAGLTPTRLPPISDITFGQNDQNGQIRVYRTPRPSVVLPFPVSSTFSENGVPTRLEIPSLGPGGNVVGDPDYCRGAISLPKPIVSHDAQPQLPSFGERSIATCPTEYREPSSLQAGGLDLELVKERKRAQNRENGRRFRAAKRQRWSGLEERNAAYSQELLHLTKLLRQQQRDLRAAGISMPLDELLQESSQLSGGDAEHNSQALSPSSKDEFLVGDRGRTPSFHARPSPLSLPSSARLAKTEQAKLQCHALKSENQVLLGLLDDAARSNHDATRPHGVNRLCLLDMDGYILTESGADGDGPIRSAALQPFASVSGQSKKFWDTLHPNDETQVKTLAQHIVGLARGSSVKKRESVALSYRRRVSADLFERVKGTLELVVDGTELLGFLIAETPCL